jgi:hypothetical protein
MDWHKLQHTLFDIDPSDPREDLAKLQQAAQGGGSGNVAPTKNYLEESVAVEEGSMPLGIDSIADFAALAGVTVTEKENPFAPDAAEKQIKGAWEKVTGVQPEPKAAATTKKTATPGAVSSMEWQKFLKTYTKQLQQIAADPEKLKRFDTWLAKWNESVEEKDERKIKPRDPSAQTLNDLRSSGAMGAHKDKKKLAKQGYSKHKGKQYESIKDELWARLNELGKS